MVGRRALHAEEEGVPNLVAGPCLRVVTTRLQKPIKGFYEREFKYIYDNKTNGKASLGYLCFSLSHSAHSCVVRFCTFFIIGFRYFVYLMLSLLHFLLISFFLSRLKVVLTVSRLIVTQK